MLLLQGVVCCLITLDLCKKRNKIQKGCRFLCLKYLSTSALLPKKGMPPTNSGAGSTLILLVFRVHSCLIVTGKVLKRFPLSCEAQGEPSTEPFLQQQPLTPKTAGHSEINVQNSLCEHSKKRFGRRKPFAAKNPRRQTRHWAPKPLLTMAEDPKPNSVQKDAKKSWRNWETHAKKWWGGPLRNLSESKGICPRRRERSRNLRNLRESLVEPGWSLGGTSVEPSTNLLAAQDASAPENQRH